MSEARKPAEWNLDAELERIDRQGTLSKADHIIAYMYAYNLDLRYWVREYAESKAEHTRLRAKYTLIRRYGRDGNDPEKSGEMCGVWADEQEDVAALDLRFRVAENMMTADREQLKILHAALEKWRTDRADERAADQFQGRTQT